MSQPLSLFVQMEQHPTIIFKGQNFLKKWGDDNVSDASWVYLLRWQINTLTLTERLCISENRWTDGELAFKWIIKDFDLQTCEKAGGETWVLLMDGHSSHYSADLLEYCVANNIEVLCYPPHCTHALQGCYELDSRLMTRNLRFVPMHCSCGWLMIRWLVLYDKRWLICAWWLWLMTHIWYWLILYKWLVHHLPSGSNHLYINQNILPSWALSST